MCEEFDEDVCVRCFLEESLCTCDLYPDEDEEEDTSFEDFINELNEINEMNEWNDSFSSSSFDDDDW